MTKTTPTTRADDEHRAELRAIFLQWDAFHSSQSYAAQMEEILHRIVRADSERLAAQEAQVELVQAAKVAHVNEPVVHAVWFQPEALLQGDAFHTIIGGGRRTQLSGSWENFCRFLDHSTEGDPSLEPDRAKRAAGALVVGRYEGAHGHADMAVDFLGTRILCLDGDAADPHAVADYLSDYTFVLHTTYKHRPSAPRCRVFLQLEDECTERRAYNTCLRSVAEDLSNQGFTFPAADSNLGKLAFLPMHARGVEPVFITHHGRPLDLDAIVANAPTPKICERGRGDYASFSSALARARDAVVVAVDHESQRHNTRRKWARWLSEIGCPDRDIEDACLPDDSADDQARKVVGWAIRVGRDS